MYKETRRKVIINLRKDPKTDIDGHNFIQRVTIRFSEQNQTYNLHLHLGLALQYKIDILMITSFDLANCSRRMNSSISVLRIFLQISLGTILKAIADLLEEYARNMLSKNYVLVTFHISLNTANTGSTLHYKSAAFFWHHAITLLDQTKMSFSRLKNLMRQLFHSPLFSRYEVIMTNSALHSPPIQYGFIE